MPVNVEGYEVRELLGRGGMGSVYEAVQIDLGRLVALKVIHPFLADDGDFKSRFRLEMKLASSLEHPNIVPVYEAKEVNGQAYIAMALIPGENLAKLIKRDGPLDPELVVGIISQVAAALDAAHGKGIIHRDVKPANILIDNRVNHAYLSDFGIAKSLDATSAITRTGQGIGAIRYVAPEQIRDLKPDRRTDIYSLGCVLFEALTGDLPFKDGSEAFVLMEKLNAEPRRPSKINPTLDPAFDRVSDIALARNPDDRFDTAGDFAKAARKALVGQAPTKILRRTSGQDETTKLPPEPAPRGSKSETLRRRYGLAAMGCLLVFLLALGGYALSRTGGDGTDSRPAPVKRAQESTKSVASGGTDAVVAGDSGGSTETLTPARSVTVDRNLFSAEVPSGWLPEEIDEENSGRYTNVWSDPSNKNTSVLIDSQSPAPLVSAMESATSVREQTSQSDGFSEISFSEVEIAGRPTARWVFDLPEGRKVDYFFQECDVGVAVLGKAPRKDFAAMEPTFRRVAASVTPRCDSNGAGSSITSESSDYSGYIAQLGSFTSQSSAETFSSELSRRGVSTRILWSSDYPQMAPGYWVVFSGPFSTPADADSAASSSGESDAISRYISQG